MDPSQISSQNLVELSFPTMNLVLWKKTVFVRINPFQNGESFGCAIICARVLECRYLLHNNYTHTPLFSTKGLYGHLLSSHLFFTS